MHVTYIYHSGFLVELDTMYLLFDYYKGELPEWKDAKPLYVFASHAHQDHFNPQIFALTRTHKKVHYILSKDIKLTPRKCEREKITAEDLEKVIWLKAAEKELFNLDGLEETELCVETFQSTDRGVAFLVQAEGKQIFHAGDLNWWIWEEKDKCYNNNMTARFLRELEKLQGREIDVAFLPLDPRQEIYYAKGIEKYREVMKIRHIFPMHMWENYGIISQYEKEYGTGRDGKVYRIRHKNQIFHVD